MRNHVLICDGANLYRDVAMRVGFYQVPCLAEGWINRAISRNYSRRDAYSSGSRRIESHSPSLGRKKAEGVTNTFRLHIAYMAPEANDYAGRATRIVSLPFFFELRVK